MNVLEVSGLCKRYPRFALTDVNFSMREGRIMGLIGRNGAGKTTTLKTLLNFVHRDAGSIRFFGLDFDAHEQEIKRRIGFVSGGVDFYPRKTLKKITAVTRSFYDTWDEAAYCRNLVRFSLDERKTPAQLSAGMKVKYALALALSHRAELLLLDEPTSGLDPVSRAELLDIFLSLAEEGVSILFSTHITSDLDWCADDITYIRNGRIAAAEPKNAFLSRYRTVLLAEATEAQKPLLIGARRLKSGVSALIETRNENLMPCRPATLEDIMVHLEKEGEA